MSTDRERGLPPGPAAAGAAVDPDLVRRLRRSVADRLTGLRQERASLGDLELGVDDERQLTLQLIREQVRALRRTQVSAGQQLPDPDEDVRLAAAIEAAIFGAGSLQELLDDPWIENIDINGCDEVWLTYADERGKVAGAPVAGSDEELIEVVRNLASYAGLNARPFSPANPQLDLRLKDGSRLSATMSVAERPTASIRRNRLQQAFLARIPPAARVPARSGRDGGDGTGPARTLLQLGTVDEQLAGFLEAAVLARCNMVIAGATDAGKTTLLRALIHCIPAQERLITVEKALELGLRRDRDLHPDTVEMEEVLPGPDGSGGMSIGDLVRRSLRMNPSRVIVGEVLGPEVSEMLSAMTQGNDGSLSTIHARSADDVFFRLAMLAGQRAPGQQHVMMDFPVAQAHISRAVDFVVFTRKNPRQHGARMVMEVLEVAGYADGRVSSSRVFTEGEDGRARRDAEIPIMRAHLLREHGYSEIAFATDPISSGTALPGYPTQGGYEPGQQVAGQWGSRRQRRQGWAGQ